MVATQRKRKKARFETLADALRHFLAGAGNLIQVLGTLVPEALFLGYLDVNVARVLNFVSKAVQGGVQPRGAHGRGTHIYATPFLAEVEGDAKNPDFHLRSLLPLLPRLPLRPRS